MIIGSKLPPIHGDNTYFNLGRSAFAYLISEVVNPKKVYLPAFTCWSLVSTMERRFPNIELEFYSVNSDLECFYPDIVKKDELLVFIHFFGKENKTTLPPCDGTILEDISHALASKFIYRGNYVFGSLRKIIKIADGGIIRQFFNPIYEPSKKLDTWLRYEAVDWKDMREAENMIDRDWQITDISSQSLEIFLRSDLDTIRILRSQNDKFLYKNLSVGAPLITYKENEAPLVHNRLIETTKERDSLRAYLATKGIFTSIHWPTHRLVKESRCDIKDVNYLESHLISIPVSQDYSLNDMEYITDIINSWK
jgi:hypothetical protein